MLLYGINFILFFAWSSSPSLSSMLFNLLSLVKSNSFTVDGQTCRIVNEQAPNVATTKLQIVASGTGTIIVDNIGSYSTTTGILSIVGFTPNGLLGGETFIKISATPANQSAIVPERNNIINYDPDASTFTAVATEADY